MVKEILQGKTDYLNNAFSKKKLQRRVLLSLLLLLLLLLFVRALQRKLWSIKHEGLRP